MDSNFITDIIRRSNRNQLIMWGIGLIVVLVAISFSINQYYNLLAGPFEVDKAYIEGIKDVTTLDKFYVTVKGDKTVDTLSYVTNTTNGIETSKYYYKAQYFDENMLLVKTGIVENQLEYTGALTTIPSDDQREVIDPFGSDVFLPFMLDASDFRNTGFAGMAAAAIALLICLWGVLRTIGRIINLERHPIWRGLERFGQPASIADQISTEVSSSAENVGKAQVTRNWLVAAQKSALGVTQLKDIMWVYKKVVSGRGGKRISALIYDRYGQMTTINGKEAQIDETLRGIAHRMPWITVGYSKEAQAAWTKDRANFIAAVDQRKKQENQ